MRIVLIILVVLIVLLGLVFTVLNAEPVTVDYYYGTVTIPLAMVIVLATAAGALLEQLAGVGPVLRQRRQVVRLRRQVTLAEKEINNLRTLPIKDVH